MARISVQKVESKLPNQSKRKTYALVCYFYPQYTLKDVQKLPARDVNLLLMVARQQEAAKMYNAVIIANSQNAKDKKTIKDLLQHFEKLTQDDNCE